MNTNNAEFQEYNVGDRVRVTAGLLADEVGTILRFELGEIEPLLILGLDSIPFMEIPALLSTVEVIGHNQPEPPPIGMTSQQTADMVDEFVRFCQLRVKGVGDEQYSQGTHQKFEAMDLDELIEYMVEELADVVNYSTFLYVRLSRIRSALKSFL